MEQLLGHKSQGSMLRYFHQLGFLGNPGGQRNPLTACTEHPGDSIYTLLLLLTANFGLLLLHNMAYPY